MDDKLPYYCSQKFTWLTVDFDKRTTKSCCDVPEVKIDLTWLKDNPGKLFNNETYINERKYMLDGGKLDSCQHCWINESNGIPSRREMCGAKDLTHQDIISEPTMLNIDLGHECNMSCVYCNTHHSSSWLREVKRYGEYPDNKERFKIQPIDVALSRLSVKEKQALESTTLLLDEIKQYKNLDFLEITGGEPFLYNNLVNLCQSISAKDIRIVTGLGVNPKRFRRILEQLPKETTMIISAESVGQLYEFVRHGNSYENFLTNLKTVQEMKFNYYFSCAIGNLTIHGFNEFQKTHGTGQDHLLFISSPDYLTIDLLDDYSRKQLLDQNFGVFDIEIKTALNNKRKLDDRLEICSSFLSQISKKRNLDLSVFPKSFIEFLKL